jgi:Thaumatin family
VGDRQERRLRPETQKWNRFDPSGHWRGLFILILLLLAGCGGSSSNSASAQPAKISISAPDAEGIVTITGTAGAVPGAGTVNATATSATATISSCAQSQTTSSSNGSFTLTVCAQINSQININFTDSQNTTSKVGSFTVPVPSTANACASGQRPIVVTNECPQAIWAGYVSGTIQCLKDSDCPNGGSSPSTCVGANPTTGEAGTCGCNPSDGSGTSTDDCNPLGVCQNSTGHCFWNSPTVSPQSVSSAGGGNPLELAANGGTTTLCFQAPASPTARLEWSGGIFPRTGCNSTGQQCQGGECGANSQGVCPTFNGPNPPGVQSEFTLGNPAIYSQSRDFYDVTIINGFNVPQEMAPITLPGGDATDAANAYSCGSPGNPQKFAIFTGCTWNYNPPAYQHESVQAVNPVVATTMSPSGCPAGTTLNNNFCTCTTATNGNTLNDPCAAAKDSNGNTLACGPSLNTGIKTTGSNFVQVCGTPIGWWTADELCTASDNAGTPYKSNNGALDCSTTFQNSDSSTSNYGNLFGCKQPKGAPNPEQAQSCYSAGAVSDCCGCPTFNFANSPPWPSEISAGDTNCAVTNSTWDSDALPWIAPLKSTCQTAYTFPFDDPTSTFTCPGSGTAPVPYIVTFCPDNVTGTQ